MDRDPETSESLIAPTVREPIRTKEVGWLTLLTFVGATAALLVLVPLLREVPLGALLRGPSWWENLNLFVLLLIVTVGGVAFLMGRLRPAHVGLRGRKLIEGIAVTLLAWSAMQAWPFIASGTAEYSLTWSDPGVLATLRWTAVMFLATALWEEVAFRGFLLPQLYLKIAGHRWLRLWGALILSQIIFAAAHAPAHIMLRDLSGGPLLQMLLLQGFAGLLLGLLYLRTRNLWIAVGIHGLANAPTPAFGGALGWEIPLLLILIAWPWIRRRPQARGFATVQRRTSAAQDRI